MEDIRDIIQAGVALISGDIVGGISDRLTSVITQRVGLVKNAKLGEKPTSFLETLLAILLNAGFIGAGVQFAVGAQPLLLENPMALISFITGVVSQSRNLGRRLSALNSFVLLPVTDFVQPDQKPNPPDEISGDGDGDSSTNPSVEN